MVTERMGRLVVVVVVVLLVVLLGAAWCWLVVLLTAAASPLVASCKELQPHQSGRRLPPKI